MDDILSGTPLSHFSSCGCSACSEGYNNQDPVLDAADSLYTGTDDAPTVYGSAQVMADQLVSGYWQSIGWDAHQWGTSTVTYSLSSAFTSAEQASFTNAFAMWSDVADINFQLVSSGAQITIVEGTDGRAWSGNVSYNPVTMDMSSNTISIDTDVYGWDDIVTLGKYGFQTILHEIGHSLGLGHQGNYNGAVNYDTDVQYLNDNRQYSIMSYNNANLLGTDHFGESGSFQYAATPFLYDIMAIQQIYGVNTSTRSGDTTYGFNSNAGRDQYDLTLSEAPFAIWDGAGNDTLDLSGYSQDQTITLVQGEFTSAGFMTNNIVIAYGAVIENAVGGSGNDTISGNDADNILQGGAGNDILNGSAGSDTLDGEDGTDTVSYSYDISDFLISIIDSVTLSLENIAQAWSDTVSNVESFLFNNVAYTYDEVANNAVTLDTYTSILKWSGQQYYHQSSSVGTDTVTAEQAGFGNTTGDLVTYSRTAQGLAINVDNSNAPGTYVLYGQGNDDNFAITGTHSAFNVNFNGYLGDDTLTISGVTGDDRLYGGGGDDTISSGAGNDKVYGGDDNDTLNGDDGNDLLSGEAGNDTLDGGIGHDYLYGGDGLDDLTGGAGNDYISGGDGNDTINGGAGLDKIYGGIGNDIINGGDDRDVIAGDAGLDTINGEAGNDVIYGNAGDDVITGGIGADLIYGGNDDDTISGDDGVDYLYGELGDDTINGGADGDVIRGADGYDILNGDGGNDTIYGDNHNDTINGGDGDDTINGGADNDTIHGDADNDTIYGATGNDYIYGDDGTDQLHGNSGNDVMYGGTGNDILSGDDGTDTLRGGDDDDTLYGDADDDILYGESGIDRLYGGTGGDTLRGGADNDILSGDSGADTIYGDDGNDMIYGGTEDDILYGGAGEDSMWGGAGADTFMFQTEDMDGTINRIKDFQLGDGDSLNITDILVGYTSGSSDINDFVTFTAPNGSGDVSMAVDRDGTGSTYSSVWVAKISTAGTALDAQTLLDNGDLIV